MQATPPGRVISLLTLKLSVFWACRLEAGGELRQECHPDWGLPGKRAKMRSCGREAEGGGLLNRYTVEKPNRGFFTNPSGSATLRPDGLRVAFMFSTWRRVAEPDRFRALVRQNGRQAILGIAPVTLRCERSEASKGRDDPSAARTKMRQSAFSSVRSRRSAGPARALCAPLRTPPASKSAQTNPALHSLWATPFERPSDT